MFNDLIGKIQEQVGNENEFTTNINLNLTREKTPIDEYPEEVRVTFRIDTDWKDWGLKSLDMFFVKPLEVDYYLEDDTKKSFTLDLNNIDQTFIRGGGFTPDYVDVHLNEDGSLYYANLVISKFTDSEV